MPRYRNGAESVVEPQHMTGPIAEEVLAHVRRKASRRVAAVLVRLMADTDTGFDVIAKRLGRDEEQVRKWLYGFIDGHGSSLNVMSELAFSMGAEFVFSVEKYEPPYAPAEADAAPVAATA